MPRSSAPTVYFKNRDILSRVKKLADKIPNSSVSSIVNAVLEASIDGLERKAPNSRSFELIIQVVL